MKCQTSIKKMLNSTKNENYLFTWSRIKKTHKKIEVQTKLFQSKIQPWNSSFLTATSGSGESKNHSFNMSASFSWLLTPSSLPSAVFYYYLSVNLAKLWLHLVPLQKLLCQNKKTILLNANHLFVSLKM